MKKPKTALDAVAEAWASMDGKLEKYEIDRETEGGTPSGWRNSDEDDVIPDGYYDGYQADARALIERLKDRGYTVVPTPKRRK